MLQKNQASSVQVKNALNNQFLKNLIVIFSGILVTALFFRQQLLSHGTLIFGDQFDGLIEFSLLQHWYNFFHGIENWRTVGYFYPYQDTLGYNDGYFLYGVIYTLIRMFKINLFIASELVNVVIRLVGFYSFFYLCHRKLGLKFFVCLLTAAIFSLNTAVFQQTSHVQLFSVSLAPLLTIFVINYFDALLVTQNSYRAIFWGSMAGIFYSAWLISTYYMAWFYALFACIMLFFMALSQYRHRLLAIKRPSLMPIFIPMVMTLIALIPFLMTYVPIGRQTGMHDFRETIGWNSSLFNLINTGSGNLLWGQVMTQFHFGLGEMVVGYPFIFLFILLFSIVDSVTVSQIDSVVFYRPLAYAIIVSILISISIFHFSFWYVVWKFFLGARGLRVVCRYWIFLVFPMCILISYYLSNRVVWSFSVFCFLIPMLLIAEQINLMHGTNLNAKNQQAFVDSIKPIPRQCQSFFVVGTRYGEMDSSVSNYLNNVDAMMISEIIGVRTINGNSTFNPPDWNFGYYPTETYLDRINRYAKTHAISAGLCSFDIIQSQWVLLSLVATGTDGKFQI